MSLLGKASPRSFGRLEEKLGQGADFGILSLVWLLLTPFCRELAIGVKHSQSTLFAYHLTQEIVYEILTTREVCRGIPRCQTPRQGVVQHPLDARVRS